MAIRNYNFAVLLEEGEDGMFIAEVPSLSGCYTQGKTKKQALERIKEVIEMCLEEEKERIFPRKIIGVEQVEVAA